MYMMCFSLDQHIIIFNAFDTPDLQANPRSVILIYLSLHVINKNDNKSAQPKKKTENEKVKSLKTLWLVPLGEPLMVF